MSRLHNKTIMGFYAIDPEHHAAITSLVAPATPAHKLLDPFAGEGAFLDVATKAWHMTPYANELDGERAAACRVRFGPKQAVQCDAERLNASLNAFSIGWINPPYDHDKVAKDSKRVEFRFLRHAWKWIQPGGLALWAIYLPHLTEDAMSFLAQHSTRVDVWALPGKHLNHYDQIVVAAIKGTPVDAEALYDHIVAQKADPTPLTVQAEPVYKLPPPPKLNRFVFAPDVVDEGQGLQLIEAHGAWQAQGFQSLLDVPPPPRVIEPVVAPRPGHMALVLAAGVADGAVIESAEHGTVAIRGKTQPVEQVARVDVETDPNNPDHSVTKTTVRLKPTTTLTLLGQDGTVTEMDGDEALLGFITRNKQALTQYLNHKFDPMYTFDLHGMGSYLKRIRLKGIHPLFTAQQHVIAAITTGLTRRKSVLLAGQMGVGKTAVGSTVAAAIASGVIANLRGQIRADQVVLIVAPPHLIDKWKRELLSIHPNSIVERLDRHEDVQAFMDKAAQIGGQIPKIGLIKRDLTKLGAERAVAVVWRKQPVARWRNNQPTPEGYTPDQRVTTRRVPTCPHCGEVVTRDHKGQTLPANESWLKSGKRACQACNTPLWQERRDRGSRPKAGEKYAPKNPRYRLDSYLKRQYPDRVYLLIWDELHEAAHGSTGNGEAFGRMAGIAHKVLGLTGTPFNGRASSLFNLEYHMNERVRDRYNWGGSDRYSRKVRGSFQFQGVVDSTGKQRGRAESRWVEDMGVREQIIEERPTYDQTSGAYTGTTTYERPYQEAPGISPQLVAEVLDHTVFFSLADLGKYLPQYEEIAIPVQLDDDVAGQYDRTRNLLKDYLIQRKWEGDNTFRGAYLQWALGWPSAPFRDTTVIHHHKHPVTQVKTAHTVTQIPSYGEDRVYAKEQALIDLLQTELAAGRPCVVYLRQTGTRDIQPRIDKLIRQHVPDAVPFVLKNTVSAERREAVIETERKKGMNVLITNPELVKTGLDLLFAPTLIFYEITFNLGTMMQAAARSYRLNQTHEHCKTIYLYAENTMEHTAVQLMSRKQRAAKLLTGDIGLTGLDALTNGEGSLEEALLDVIARDTHLLDPAEMFKRDTDMSTTDDEDAAYWNVETDTPNDIPDTPPLRLLPPKPTTTAALQSLIEQTLREADLLSDAKHASVVKRIMAALTNGIPDPQTPSQACTPRNTAHHPVLIRWLTKYLRSHKAIPRDQLATVSAEWVSLAQHLPAPKAPVTRNPRTLDRMAVPDDTPPRPAPNPRPKTSTSNDAPQQLTLFPMPNVYP